MVDHVEGNGQNLVLVVNDAQGISDFVTTTFSIWYYSKASVIYYLRYSGDVKPEYVTQNGNSFSIAVGHMPINSRYLESGTEIKIELDAHRSFAGHSAKKSLEKSATIQ